MAKIEDLVAIRKSIKETEIKPVEKETPAEAKILKTIKEIMDARKASFIRGLELVEVFGKLNVSVNVHQVTNQHGTVFPRCFHVSKATFQSCQIYADLCTL